MKYIRARAPGKCILFGEHSVVYGYPAIAMGITLGSVCEIEALNNNKITIFLESYNKNLVFSNIDDLIVHFPPEFKQFSYCLKRFKENYTIDFNNIRITLSSTPLLSSSGLGSSASSAVALVSAINSFYNIQLNRRQISHFALDMEKLVHGTPSGIDNTVCTYGSIIFYEQGEFRFIETPNNLNLLVTYTNIKHDTGKAIEKFREFTKQNPDYSDQLLSEMGMIAREAEHELINLNIEKIGVLMNKNQKLLEIFGISNENISEIIDIALNNGAFGSKITGAGLGGSVISVGSPSKLEHVAKSLENEGYYSFHTGINRQGVRVESN